MKIKIGGAALNQTPLDWEGNKKNILSAIEEAKKNHIEILCLPELCITGYGCEDTFLSHGVHENALKILKEIVPHTKDIIVAIGLPLFYKSQIYNVACFLVNGEIKGFIGKKNLAGDGIHYEPRWFKPWEHNFKSIINIDNIDYPIGDIFFNVSGIKIGFEICEDAWVANRPGRQLFTKGVDIILNLSASHFAFEKYEIRKRFILEASRSFGVSYIYSNLLGCEAGRIIYDGGTIIASEGKLLACGKRFSYEDIVLTSSVIDIPANKIKQSKYTQPPNNEHDYPFEIECKFSFKDPDLFSEYESEPWEKSSQIKFEEFTRAITLGLFDYMRKSKSHGFVVSLSGGADSSAVACLVHLMFYISFNELGEDGFKKKLSYIPDLNTDFKALNKNMLTTVYQASINNSNVTRHAAKIIAEKVVATHYELDINNLIDEYIKKVSDAMEKTLNWQDDDVSLQNIQARVRGPSAWLIANIKNSLLLTTSNRSEIAMGYATMDGDTCGGLAPLGGIDKAFLREWLLWLEKIGPHGIYPIPELSVVNNQVSTAELRPISNTQTDENDLMPYEVLNSIEKLAILNKKTPLEVYKSIKIIFKNKFTDGDLKNWTIKFFQLWCRTQWKRERFAPSFHLDDENLDPKTWCRFPILSGGYEKELLELKNSM